MTSNREAYAAQYESLAGLVRACRCGATRPFKGFDDARRDGWRWRLGVGRIEWACEEHELPPARRSA
jgi:hypothetical protein